MLKLEYSILYHSCFDFATGQVNITAKTCNFLKCLNEKSKIETYSYSSTITIKSTPIIVQFHTPCLVIQGLVRKVVMMTHIFV